MKIVERKEDDLLNAPTVVGVWKHTDLLRTYVEGEGRDQYSEALTAHKDNVVVYSDDETYEQQQVPTGLDAELQKETTGRKFITRNTRIPVRRYACLHTQGYNHGRA